MAKTNLTAQRVRELFHYDPETGVFTNKTRRSSNRLAAIGSVAGGLIPKGYRIMRINGANYYAHRLAWLYVHGAEAIGDVDHIDGNRDNNAIRNLRQATRSENLQNQRKPKPQNTSGFLGVSRVKRNGKWLAQITHGGKQRNLGHYATPEEAHAVYLAAKRQFHGFCTI